jgi:hypothetical protein
VRSIENSSSVNESDGRNRTSYDTQFRSRQDLAMDAFVFLLLEMLFLAAAHWLGGPPWTAVGAVAIVSQAFVRPQPARLLLLVPALVWLGLFRLSGNRELFFPYAMALAAFVSLPLAARRTWLGGVGGGLMVGTFLLIRILQQAGGRVLAVELAVAAVILALVLAVASRARGRWSLKAAIVATASLLAYAGLAL